MRSIASTERTAPTVDRTILSERAECLAAYAVARHESGNASDRIWNIASAFPPTSAGRPTRTCGPTDWGRFVALVSAGGTLQIQQVLSKFIGKSSDIEIARHPGYCI